MKKIIALILSVTLVMLLFGCGKKEKPVSEEIRNQIVALCDARVEEIKAEQNSYCTVNNISYTINSLTFHPDGIDHIIVDITWYVDADSDTITDQGLQEHFVTMLSGAVEFQSVSDGGHRYTLTQCSGGEYENNMRVVLNGNDPYSGQEAYDDLIERVNENKSCYVCGTKEGDLIQYGSYYYCPTHYAWVKTVVENP